MSISRRRRRRLARPVDTAQFSEAVSRPGVDPRQWISYGIVSTQAEDADVVVFDEDEGCPLVQVILQPTQVAVRCRVGATIAGNGEGEWFPFVKGDEVLVAIPEGYEDAGCVIISRLNNAIDKFPMESVAGQDPTTNSFAFQRRRTPFVQEFAGPVFLRTALSGAFFSIDEAGTVTIKDGENSAFQMSPDAIGWQGPSSTTSPPNFLLQMSLSREQFTVQVRDAVLNMSSSRASPVQNTLTVPGAMAYGTSGNPPLEHNLSTEADANILTQMFLAFAAFTSALGVAPLTGTSYGAAIAAWVLTPGFAAAWGIAATPAGVLKPDIALAIAAWAAAPVPKPNTGAVQLLPGLGCPGMLVG